MMAGLYAPNYFTLDDPDYDYEPMPQYDVTERLKEINAQWDNEPLPPSDRTKFIEFKVCDNPSVNSS